MANINQIQVGSTVYDIEDQTARGDIANLAEVATSGDYEDLSNTPTDLSSFNDDLGNSPTHTHSQYATLDSDSKITADQACSSMLEVTASKTLALTDAGKLLYTNSTSAITITIPAYTSVSFPMGTEIEICRWNTGTVTISPATDVTIVSSETARTIGARYGVIALKKLFSNTWILTGALG